TIAVGVVVVLAVACALAAAFRRLPWLLPVLALACVPARVNVHVASSGSKLLLPLYVVVLGAAVLLGWQLVRDAPRNRELRLVALTRARLPFVLTAAAAIVVTWLGLLISYSQSSFAALLVVVIVVAAIAWRWRALIAVVATLAVLAGIAASEPAVRRSIQHHTSSGLNSATSGRASLVANGIRIAEAHPVVGVGVG